MRAGLDVFMCTYMYLGVANCIEMCIINIVTLTCVRVCVFILTPFYDRKRSRLFSFLPGPFSFNYPPLGGHIIEVRSYLYASSGLRCGLGPFAFMCGWGIVGKIARKNSSIGT